MVHLSWIGLMMFSSGLLLYTSHASDAEKAAESSESSMVFNDFRYMSGGFARTYEFNDCPPPYFSGNTFEVIDYWPDGANIEVTVRPSGPVENGWTILIVFSRPLPKGARILVWNAELTAKTNGRYVTLVNRPHNPNLNNVKMFSLTLVLEGATMEEMSGYSAMVSFYQERIKDAACYLGGSNKPLRTTQKPTTTAPKRVTFRWTPRPTTARRTVRPTNRWTARPTPRTVRPTTTTQRPMRRTTLAPRRTTRKTTIYRRPTTRPPYRRPEATKKPRTTTRRPPVKTTEAPAVVDRNRPEYKISNTMVQRHKGECAILPRGYEIQNTGYDAGNDLADEQGRKYRANIGISIPVKGVVSQWTVKVVFAEPIEAIQTWEAVAAEHSSDFTVWLIRPQSWNTELHEKFEFLIITLMRVEYAPPAITYLCQNGDEPTLLGNGIFERKDGEGYQFSREEIEEMERREKERQEQIRREQAQREKEQREREKKEQERRENEEKNRNRQTPPTQRPHNPGPRPAETSRPKVYGPRCSRSDGYPVGYAGQTKVLFKKSPPKERSPYDYNEVLAMSILFYEAQRSGKLPSNNRIPWRGDSGLKDGCDVGRDLTGGWYDAGDHVKFGFPMAWSATTLAWGAIEFKDAYKDAEQFKNMLSSLKWVADYFVRAHTGKYEFYGQIGDGGPDHSYWGKAEEMKMKRPSFKIDKNNPGSELAAETAAALAAISIVFKSEDPSYSRMLLKHAQELYEFADQYRGEYHKSIPAAQGYYRSYSGYNDELVWGALWLAKATGSKAYLADAVRKYSQFGGGETPKMFSWDDKRAGSQVLIAQLTGDSKYRGHIMGYQNFLKSYQKTPQGMVWLDQWGSNRYAANAALITLAAANLHPPMREKPSLIQFGRKQIHLLLGDAGRSYVVGYGRNPPIRPHHRSSSCPPSPQACSWNTAFENPSANYFTLYGALVGGPNNKGVYIDRRSDYVSNEVATDFNAGFQSAVAGLKHFQIEARRY